MLRRRKKCQTKGFLADVLEAVLGMYVMIWFEFEIAKDYSVDKENKLLSKLIMNN